MFIPFKRILALSLCLVLALGILPAAGAEGAPQATEETQLPQPESTGDPEDAAAEEAPTLPKLDLAKNDAGLTDDQITILRALKEGAMQVDDIIEQTGLPTRRVLSALTMMELEGCVEQGGGKHFSLNVILEE